MPSLDRVVFSSALQPCIFSSIHFQSMTVPAMTFFLWLHNFQASTSISSRWLVASDSIEVAPIDPSSSISNMTPSLIVSLCCLAATLRQTTSYPLWRQLSLTSWSQILTTRMLFSHPDHAALSQIFIALISFDTSHPEPVDFRVNPVDPVTDLFNIYRLPRSADSISNNGDDSRPSCRVFTEIWLT